MNDVCSAYSSSEEKRPVVSIITVVYNNDRSISDAIKSVVSQDYPSIEYIVIDGGSTDGTVDLVSKYSDNISLFVSESDDGIYDALNKGVRLSSGKYIGILHSDDVYSDRSVISDMVSELSKSDVDLGFSNLVIVDKESGKILRYYVSSFFKRWLFRTGWMPPHPTCVYKRSLHDEFGLYSTDFKLAGDFDFLSRVFYKGNISWVHLDRITVEMRSGGASNSGVSSKYLAASEINRSLKSNRIFSLPIFQVLRYFIRALEFVLRPNNK